MNQKAPRTSAENSAVADYKRTLQRVLENRPSGTRLSLAAALGKNRSFISQITNPSYSVPIPARHIESIFDICHFLANEKAQFLEAYGRAHPQRAPDSSSAEQRWRELELRVPDLHDGAMNRQLDDLLKEMVQRIARLLGAR